MVTIFSKMNQYGFAFINESLRIILRNVKVFLLNFRVRGKLFILICARSTARFE